MEVDTRQFDGLIFNQDREGLQSVAPEPRMPEKHDAVEAVYSSSGNQPIKSKRILGLTVPTFWIVTLVVVMILAGGIGGGVGGGLAAKKYNNSASW
jgi:hypothetical protein